MRGDKLTVIGAGTMGHGIAGQAAWRGLEVHLYDPSLEALTHGHSQIQKVYQKGVARQKMSASEAEEALGRLHLHHPTGDDRALIEAASDASIVIEAAPEKMEIKRSIFTVLESAVSAQTLLATNTSSLSISKIAQCLTQPDRFLGMHFFNPVAVMPLLEIVRGEQTTDASVDRARAYGELFLKTPIVVKDAPGFATSRLGIALGNEAMRIFEEGVASAQDIDRAMVLGYRHPIGPLALTDLVGLDIRLAISQYLHQELGTDTFKPPEVLKEKVARGELGKKSGRGFYDY
jgi:3-hydroxybutyryl-CoA dehydrogenase